ncbi:hypothetical protein [Streptomyces alkaliterrae]|uniref:DUF8094 domain-containing protein n=1 Tax=Streptomyces alkaliterrae TaxID=2213162 RepID=A0A5P0YXA1_9ACTN|nr:hypothetical protein [Streptomyces alkaliterrae]MBB1253042.1 hypothetical protein [Streptomyces alkaliterrae]MBB1257867.1 hypothetical protein [Streptomyces alkaliterrae]MQS04217.1 hypothetical protein [Streptomyces alkaliterrae]
MMSRRTAAATVALALTGALSGCVTVHGETAVVPATTKAEAEKVLSKYLSTSNKANRNHDAALAATVERGALGEVNQASLKVARALRPEGAKDFRPLELTDTRFHIPRQAGWPKFFLADATGKGTSGERRVLLAFTRDGIGEPWRASYRAVVDAADVPEFAEDEEGHAVAFPAPDTKSVALAAEPDELSKAYVKQLKDGKGPFADGPYTSGKRENRRKNTNRPTARNEWADQAADSTRYAPFGLYTGKGDALVFFTSHLHTKQTAATGYKPSVLPEVEPLLKGQVKRSLTQTLLLQHAVLVPTADSGDKIDFLYQHTGRISAKGE